jgi:polyvinyl alcohol dehydrogenase (cytochrome)
VPLHFRLWQFFGHATGDARLLWEVDTARDYATVNGVSARGGAMDGPGPTIVDGMLYVNSGYGQWAVCPATPCWHSKSGIPDKAVS